MSGSVFSGSAKETPRLFITIAERINATRKNIREAIEKRDAEAIKAEAVEQAAAGASLIDVNGGTRPDEERANLDWLIDVVTGAADRPLCVDSANPSLLEEAAGKILSKRGAPPPENGLEPDGLPWLLLNSLSAEKDKYDGVLPVALKHKASVVALLMDDSGMPEDAAKRIETGRALVKRLVADGVPHERIFADPLIMPAGVNPALAAGMLKSVRALRDEFPGIHITCGLTNISHGLPARHLLNRTYLAMLVAAGLDSAIMDPTDVKLRSALRAALALTDKDPYCSDYIRDYRKKLLDA